MKQVDSLLSKNLAHTSLTTNDVTIKSREQGLITKECIATHTNLLLSLNLYFSVSLIKAILSLNYYCEAEA